MKQITIRIPDMQSAHCQARVSAAVRAIPGVHIEKVEASVLTVSYGDAEDEIIHAIEKAGYTVSSAADKD